VLNVQSRHSAQFVMMISSFMALTVSIHVLLELKIPKESAQVTGETSL